MGATAPGAWKTRVQSSALEPVTLMYTVLPVELAEMVSTSPLLLAYEYDSPWVMKSLALPLTLKVPVATVLSAVGVGDGKAPGVVLE
jgi:hypothetical protein